MRYIIEHMEPEMYDWCVIEYEHISEIVGKDNLIFTNVKEGKEKIEGFGEIYEETIFELTDKFPGDKMCLLDPNTDKTLTTEDDKEFEFMLFGGILGDFPRKHRTKKLSELTNNKRNLGSEQMSTDTAVLVTHKILNGEKFEDIPFQDGIDIEMGNNESLSFPFRYVLKDGKPVISPKLIKYLKEKEEF